MAEAIALYDELAAAVPTAEATIRRLERAQANGDVTVTAAQIVLAREEHESAIRLRDGQKLNVLRAQKAEVTETPDLAEIVAEVLREHTQFPVTVTCDRAPQRPTDVPAFIVSQHKPSRADTIAGHLSGEVTVFCHRDGALHKAFLHEVDLAKILATRQVSADSGTVITRALAGGPTDGRPVVDELVVAIAYAWPAYPVIRPSTQDGFRFGQYADSLCELVRRRTQPHDAPPQGVRIGAGDARAVVAATEAKAGVKVGRDATDDDGVRSRSVEITLEVSPRRGNPYSRSEIAGAAVRVIEAQVGSWASGLGRVASVQTTVELLGEKGAAVTANVTFVSKVPERAVA